jgi:hypothetical protein
MGGKGRCNPASEYVDRWVQARRLLGCGEEPTQSTAHRARCPGEKLKYVFTLMILYHVNVAVGDSLQR